MATTPLLPKPSGGTDGQVLTRNAASPGGVTWADGATGGGGGGGGPATPTGAAGGDLGGTYPNPTIGTGAVGTTKLAAGAVTLAKLATDVTDAIAAATGGAAGLTYRGPWAPSTAYAVNDLITHGEGVYVVTSAHTSTAPFTLTGKARLNGRRGVFDVQDYGATGDGRAAPDGSITSGSATLTSGSNPWTSADVGKAILVNGAGPGGVPHVTTIAAYVSAGQVTLAAAAGATISGADCLWGTDDADAIRTALYAAVNAGVANGTWYAELRFPPALYTLSSAPKIGSFNPGVTGASNQTWGNALIPLPVFPVSGRKFVLSLTGAADGTGIAWYQQDRPHLAGSALIALRPQRDTLDGTWYEPAVIGGPTRDNYTASGGALPVSNLLLSVDGLQIVTPHDGGWDGLNAYNLAQCNVRTLGCTVFAYVDGAPDVRSLPTRGCVGLRMPRQLNNDDTTIWSYTSYGYYYGLLSGDHLVAQRLLLLYANVGWLAGLALGSTWYHGATVQYLSAEAVGTAVQVDGNAGGTLPVNIGYLDCEVVTTILDDPSNTATGTIRVQNGTDPIVVNGGGRVTVLSLGSSGAPGAKTAPSVPASGTPLRNPFWAPCSVVVTGGTVTGIAVDGQTLGITSGLVTVPSGKTVTLTYSSAPTWTWTAQ
jgi:hypothetical protein